LKLAQDEIENLLETWPVARLATVSANGRPHLVPVVFARWAERLFTPVDGKPKSASELKRVRNARECVAASLLLDAYSEDWTQLWWLRVDAEIEVVEPREDRDELVSGAVAALRRKYPQYETVAVLRDPPTLLALRPDRITSWCAGPIDALIDPKRGVRG
jgi:PPOX class probable F420-dependent enzyme